MVDLLHAPLDSADQAEDYIDGLWWLLHHSEEEDRLVLGLTCYLDDSGSDDGSPLVTCGGLLMTRIQFKNFSSRWDAMYKRNKFSGYLLEPPLHMTDFVGHGKYATLPVEFKRALFLDVARLIRDHRLYSIAVAISQIDYAKELSEDVSKNLIGPYAFAFFSIVGAHQAFSEQLRRGPLRTAYLVDHGFGHYQQLVDAHRIIEDFEIAMHGRSVHTGPMDSEPDDKIPALQAADVISWAVRRVAVNKSLPEGFEPLADAIKDELIDGPHHVTVVIPRDGIHMLAKPINNWIKQRGSLPELRDIVVRQIGNEWYKLNP